MKLASRFQYKFFSYLFAAGALSFLSAALVFGDTTISTDTQLTGDADYSGVVTVNSGVTLDLNGYTLGTVGNVTNLLGTGTITNTSGTKSTVTVNIGATNDGLAPTLTGNLDFVFNANDKILRLRNAAADWTGSTTINGGRLHVDTQDCIGSGTILLNGNLVNDSNGHTALTLSNPVAIIGPNASIRAAYSGSITLTGKVSDYAGATNPKFTIGAKESVANTYKLYGENDYTCGTWIGDASYTGLTLKISIGTPTAFGTGPIQMVSNANLTLEKYGSTTANSLANTIHLGGKTLNITNSTGGAVTISAPIDNLNSAGSAVATAGKLTINGGEKAVTLSGPITGAVDLSLTNKNGFTFSGSAGDGTSLSFKTTGTGTISGAITGTAILTLDNNGADTYYRLPNGAQDRTGATYINGGNRTRVHVTDGASLGTGPIYLNGNLCNNSSGSIHATFPQTVYIAGETASIRAAYEGSITVTGKISDLEGATNPKFTIAANENAANTYKLYGENDYTCGTWVGVSSYADLTHKIFIRTPSAFGTGPIQMVSNANLTLEKTETTSANSLANTIHLGGKKLNVTNSTGGAITFTTPVDNLNASGASAGTAGTLAINGGDYAVTFSGDITGNAAVSITGKAAITFNGTLQDNASLSFKSTGLSPITGTLTDAGTLTFDNNGAAVYYRLNAGAQERTGATYINGGNNTRVHVSYGSYLGTGPIYLNGNLCNNNTGTQRVSFSQPIIVNGGNASLRVAYVDMDSKAMMKITGVISSDPAHDADHKLTFNAVESGPGVIFLYGENTFTCPSFLSGDNNSNKLVLGTDSSLGESTLTANGSGTLYLETNEADATRTLDNTLKIAKDKTLRIETVSTTWNSEAENSSYTFAAAKGNAVVSSAISGATGSKLIFGSNTAAMNSGPVTFSGTAGTEETPLAVSVTAGQKFISDEALVNGTLTMAAASTLEVPTSLKVTGDMTAPKTIDLSVDDSSSNSIILDVGGTLVIPGGANIQIASAFENPDASSIIQVLSADSILDETGAQYTPAQLLAMVPDVLPSGAGWDYVAFYANNGIGYRADLTGVPEPATWVLLVMGLAGLVYAGRKKMNTV